MGRGKITSNIFTAGIECGKTPSPYLAIHSHKGNEGEEFFPLFSPFFPSLLLRPFKSMGVRKEGKEAEAQRERGGSTADSIEWSRVQRHRVPAPTTSSSAAAACIFLRLKEGEREDCYSPSRHKAACVP